MGATLDRITILPLASLSEDLDTPDAESKSCAVDVSAYLSTFDARNAQCYDTEQRERLLAIIDAGFGGLPAFNDQMVEILQNVTQSSGKKGLAGATGKGSSSTSRMVTLNLAKQAQSFTSLASLEVAGNGEDVKDFDRQ